MEGNQLTGGLEPLRGCTALRALCLEGNHLTGLFEPLLGCTMLRTLSLEENNLMPTNKDKAHFEKQCATWFTI